MDNLFAKIPAHLPEELFEKLLQTPAFTLERIVSRGHSTPPGEWYDQERDEWVLVVRGKARLGFEEGQVEMQEGDYLLIPARRKHRVEWTDPQQETVWLALHFG